MKAVAYEKPSAKDALPTLCDVQLPMPQLSPRDILVEINAIAVNPVDCKIRRNVMPNEGEYKVLGWDAAGVVKEVGPEVRQFKVGDPVYYAGDLNRQGCNAEYQVVDERIAGHKPNKISFEEAAALPLTFITAWELLFDRLQVPLRAAGEGGILLITGGAGGVGSAAIQLAKQLTSLTVVTTASRPESREWAESLGADFVLDHSQDLVAQWQNMAGDLGARYVDYVISLTHTDQHYLALVDILKPQGRFALIDDPADIDIKAFKRKSISLHWEFMYTRSMFETDDMGSQSDLLNKLAALVDEGRVKTTLQEVYGNISAANLSRAHAAIESQRTIGKIVCSGFD